MAVRILHLRHRKKKFISATNPFGVTNLGGATIAYEVTGSGTLIAAIQNCFSSDNFVRKEGRERALAKLAKGEFHTVECFHVEEIKSCLVRWYNETYGTRYQARKPK